MADSDAIRNVALIGHGGAGKTAFFESALFSGGAIARPEAVGSGRTAGADELERGMSIRTAFASFERGGVKINLFDTPGAADFTGEVILALRAAGFAALVLDGRAGVQIEAVKLWRELDRAGLPRCIIVNRLDDKSAGFERTLAGVKKICGKEPLPVTIPLPGGGVIDCLREKAYLPASGAAEKEAPVPPEHKDAMIAARIKLIEAAADGDEILTEKYILLGSLEPGDVYAGLRGVLVSGAFLPAFAASATGLSGQTAFLDFLAAVCPPASFGRETARQADGTETDAPVNPGGPARALVIKTVFDQFNGKLSWLKVVSGTLKSDQDILNKTEGKKEKIGKLYTAVGKKLVEVKELAAGDIGIAGKVPGLKTNDTLAADDGAPLFTPLRLPQPVYSLAVSALQKKDDDKLGDFFTRCAEEDKTFRYAYDGETKETVISGMGELHLSILLEAAKKTQKIALETRAPRVAYRETITKKAAAEYTHKKQTGGHGQFGRVALEIAPLEGGESYRFVNAVVGGAVSKSYIPGVEKGVLEAMERGTLAGYPVVGVEAKIVDGKEHPVDSSELAFRLAARNAFREAMRQARPALLEPVMKLTVFADQKYTGDIMSAVSAKRGKVLGQDSAGGIDEIRALVPHAELLRYAIELRSITSGTASFTLEFDRYAPVADKAAADIVKAAAAFNHEKDQDE